MMMFAALALTISACLLLYLTSPNQRWLEHPLPGPALAAGLVLLAVGGWLWGEVLQPLAGFFVALHIVMTCLFAFPYIAALRKG